MMRLKHIISVIVGLTCFHSVVYADIGTATDLFTVPYYAVNPPNDVFTPVVHAKGRTFLVWVDPSNRPWVTMHYNGRVTTAPIDSGTDYTAFPDGHHSFSIGIDKNGYLHVTGDMHYYPGVPANYLPPRYQNQTIMYWTSTIPYNVSGGFTFAGGKNASTAIPGTGFMLGRFIHDNNGELYYSTMVRAYDNGNFLQGMGAVGLYHYDVTSKTWTSIGDYASATNLPGTKYYKVFYWENSGYNPGAWFQNYQATFKFDNQNRMHFSVSGNVDPTTSVNSRVLYAVSPDNGVTWHKANGQIIPGLPLRGADGTANLADVVYDTQGNGGIPVHTDVVADQSGTPAVMCDTWRRWNGTAWTSDLAQSNLAWGARGYLGPDAKITFNEVDTIYFRRSKAFLTNSMGYLVQSLLPADNLHFFQAISDLGLHTTGSIYGVGTEDDSNNLVHVAKINFTNFPLPTPWADTDIGTNTYGGAADYTQAAFNLRSSGTGIATNADNLHLAYRSMTGNGTLIARVASQDALIGIATGAIMMRETLAANASVASMGITVSGGVPAFYRNGTNTAVQVTIVTPAQPAKWMKLTRVANVFTSYYSSDGVTWTQVGTPATIPMAATIYVGVATWAGINNLHAATLDNVTVLN